MESSKRDIIISVVACLIFVVVFVPSIVVYSRDNTGEHEDTIIADDDGSSQTEKSSDSFTESSDSSVETTSFILRSISPSYHGVEPYQAERDVRRRVESVLSQSPLIDGHNDLAYSVRQILANNVSRLDLSDLSAVEPWASSPDSNTDIRRLREGRLGGQFWSAYISCESSQPVKEFLEQIDVIKQIVKKYPETFQWADSVAGVRESFRAGKIASLVGVESGHAINSSLGVLRSLYSLGARYMTLTHSCNTPWAQSSPAENATVGPRGLTKFGVSVVQEMNRLGMMVDIAHVSSQTMMDAIAASSAPVIASHSSARAVNDHDRNVPDQVLRMIRDTRGVVMVNFYSCYLIADCEQRPATVEDVVAHINHIRSVAGVDSIGIGGDYNGVKSFPRGLEDVSGYPRVFAALIKDKVTVQFRLFLS